MTIPHEKVCRDHDAPFESFASGYFDRPDILLEIGPRGGGKSFRSGLLTHVTSRFHPHAGTRVLGGSQAQSQQIYDALKKAVLEGRGPGGDDRDAIASLRKKSASYFNGANVEILACSTTSVRGPHIPSLNLDEVDEIPDDLRDAAMGMLINHGSLRASARLTSTWHRVSGPMKGLIERADAGEFPKFTSCTFEILETCPEERSGPNLERCPECPLMRWCHAERDRNGDRPLAKLSSGHYSVEAFAQKVKAVSLRAFEADYLCLGPRPDGLWFPTFHPTTHVSVEAEYDPALDAVLSLDSGVFTGGTFFQHRDWVDARGRHERVNVFADFLAEGESAETNARALLELARVRCNGKLSTVCTDPAGGARNPVGPTVIGEYERCGLRPLRRWPVRPVSDSLALLESFVRPAAGEVQLVVHPRCTRLIEAMRNYRRAKRAGQWQDYPEDPQHPAEDLVDALRGGLCHVFPGGRREPERFVRGSSARFAY